MLTGGSCEFVMNIGTRGCLSSRGCREGAPEWDCERVSDGETEGRERERAACSTTKISTFAEGNETTSDNIRGNLMESFSRGRKALPDEYGLLISMRLSNDT